MTGLTRRIAGCHLLLRGNRWMPVSVNRTLGAHDRCSSDGAVISAYLSAVVEGDIIIGWLKHSGFIVQEVQLDSTLAPLDITAAALALQAGSADMEAAKAGVVGISSLIAGRRIKEQNTGHLPSMLREAAFERATVQILDKLQGHFVIGVLLLTADACGLLAACAPTQLPYRHTVLRKYHQHKFIGIGPFAGAGPCLTEFPDSDRLACCCRPGSGCRTTP
jgi:hypothetical protein